MRSKPQINSRREFAPKEHDNPMEDAMHLFASSLHPLCRYSFRRFTGGVSAILLIIGAAASAIAQQPAVTNPARITQVVDDSALKTLKGNIHPLAKPQYDKG